MSSKVVYSCLILFSTLIRCEARVEPKLVKENIDRHVSLQNSPYGTVTEFLTAVSIKDDEEIDRSSFTTIIINDWRKKESKIDQAYAFYTATSCKSAVWIVESVSEFVIDTYGCVFGNNVYSDTDGSIFKNNFQKMTTGIRREVVHFIRGLTNFLETFSDSSFYMDVGVLKSLISLSVKIDSISWVTDGAYFEKSYKEIVRLLLVEVTELQRYLSVFCAYDILKRQSVFDSSYVWVYFDINKYYGAEVTKALTRIRNFGLASDDDELQNCSARRILLENLIKIRDDKDPISLMVTHAKLDAHEGKPSMLQIVDKMLISFDIDVVRWYHESILLVIVELVYVMVIANGHVLSNNEITIIDEINAKIERNTDDLPPAYFVRAFANLNHINDNKDRVALVDEFFKSLPTVCFNFREDRNEKIARYLEQLLDRINNYFDDIVCAQKYMKYLRREDDVYFTPGSHDKSTLLENYADADDSNNPDEIPSGIVPPTTCDFVLRLSVFNRRAYQDINIVDQKMETVFDTIAGCCSLVMQYEKSDLNVVRTMYNIVTLLKNQRFRSGSKIEILFSFRRILNIIVAELDAYRVKHCEMKAYDYRSFDDTNAITSAEQFKNFMQKFFLMRYEKLTGFELSKLDQFVGLAMPTRYLEIDYLYNKYVKKSEIIMLYEDKVKVYWNRRLRSLKTIFADLQKMTFNSQHVYALYDIYNKFYLGVIFYEMQRVLDVDNFDLLTSELAKFKEIFDFNKFQNVFPDGLTSLTTDLNTIFSFPNMQVQEGSDAVTALRNKISEVTEKFEKFNVKVNWNPKKQTSNEFPKLKGFPIKRLIKILYDEVDTYVREFNEEFDKLRRVRV